MLAGGGSSSALVVSGLWDQPNPDKVMTQPYLGREADSFSSILHDELTGRAAAAG
jgi:hypothetical protein